MKKIHLIPIWSSFAILLLFVLFIFFAFVTFSSEKTYQATSTVEIVREKGRSIEFDSMLRERLLLENLKGKSISELAERGLIRREEIYVYEAESGEIFAVIAEDGLITNTYQLKDRVIQQDAAQNGE